MEREWRDENLPNGEVGVALPGPALTSSGDGMAADAEPTAVITGDGSGPTATDSGAGSSGVVPAVAAAVAGKEKALLLLAAVLAFGVAALTRAACAAVSL